MDDNIAIKVERVNKTFKLPHEKQSSIKGLLTSLGKRNKSYELQNALKDISFEIKKGEFFAIVGRNGSGKSTLLKILAGIYIPTSGSVNVKGSLTPFIELGVGFNAELTGRENVFLNGALLGFNRKEMDAMYDDIVKFAEIERFMDQKLKNYSSGMQVRLAFSIAIRAKGDVLLLDEVLAVGDAAFQQKCYDYFEELRLEKRTVVFVSHDMSAVRRFCTKAIYIKNGKVTHHGSVSEIADVYMQENIKKTQSGSDLNSSINSVNSIQIDIENQEKDSVTLKIEYSSKAKDDMYIGLSLKTNGMSFAEITTPLTRPFNGKGTVYYTLDTSILNSGMYQVGAGLFKLENRELLAAGNTKSDFTISNYDITKGAAIKLADSWKI